MRYVMRIAKPVSHQNFERTLRFLRGACLLECLFIPTTQINPQSNSRRGLRAAGRFLNIYIWQMFLDERINTSKNTSFQPTLTLFVKTKSGDREGRDVECRIIKTDFSLESRHTFLIFRNVLVLGHFK